MNNDISEKILDRIRKLFAMSGQQESSPNEAEIALRRCRALMDKYGVTEDQLTTSDFCATEACAVSTQIPTHIKVLGSAVALQNDCLIVRKNKVLEFRGYEVDTKVAQLTLEYLLEALKRYLRKEKQAGRVGGGRSESHDFRVGFALEVHKRCQEIDRERRSQEQTGTSSGTALVVRKLAMVQVNCGAGLAPRKKQSVRFRSGAAHMAGKEAGRSVSLNAQVSSQPSMKVLT